MRLIKETKENQKEFFKLMIKSDQSYEDSC